MPDLPVCDSEPRDVLFWMIPLARDIMSVGFVGNQNGFKNRHGRSAGLVSILAGNVKSEWRYLAPLVAFKFMFYALSAAYVFGFRLSRFDKPASAE